MFTAADIQLAVFEEVLEAIARFAGYPNLEAHVERMWQREDHKIAEGIGVPAGLKSLVPSR